MMLARDVCWGICCPRLGCDQISIINSGGKNHRYLIEISILGTSMILCFTLGEGGDNDEACQEKQG